jgi:acyl dehydratase
LVQSLGYADLAPGLRFRSPGRTLTEADHTLFMMLSGDWHPIHADAEYARATKAGQRLMHGSFGIALAMGMQTAALEFADPLIGALGLKQWDFRAPLLIGDTVHVTVQILERRPTRDGRRYVVERRLSLLRHDGTVIQEGIAAALLQMPDATIPGEGQ